MRFLDNLRFTTKSSLPLLMMAVLFAGVVGFGVVRYETITSQYGTMSTRTVPGALRLIRMNQSVLVMPYSIYRLSGLNCAGADAAVCKQTQDEFKAAITFAVKNIDEAKAVDSSRAAEYEGFKARFLAMVANATPALQSALSGDMPRALAAIAPVAEQMVPLRNDVRIFSAATLDTADRQAEKLARASRELLLTMVLMGLAAIGVGLAASWWMSVVKIARPLARLQGRIRVLADGDLSVEIEGTGRQDEVGAMARAIQVIKESSLRGRAAEAEAANLRTQAEAARQRDLALQLEDASSHQVTIGALADGLDALANGNLVHQIDVAFPAKTQQLKEDFNRAAASLRQAIGTITGAIQGMRSGTGEIAHATDDLSHRTEQQAARLEETASALDQITATVKRTAESSEQVRSIVSATHADADRSGTVVREAVTAMGEIEKSSQQIGQIIGVIDEIAFQTNLLALNAGVEAARAGEAGRGFAVVAQEVRALAQRSAEAAKEIKALVGASTQHVSHGVKLVGETGQALGRIVAQVGEISATIATIASSAQEQATGLQQVNAAVNQMDQVTQQNAAMVEQSTAASHALMQETEGLAKLTEQFQVGERTRRSPANAAAAQPGTVTQFRAPQRAAARVPAPSRDSTARKLAPPDKQEWAEF